MYSHGTKHNEISQKDTGILDVPLLCQLATLLASSGSNLTPPLVHWTLLQQPSTCDGVRRPEWIWCVQHWSGDAKWYNPFSIKCYHQFSITVDRWWIICIGKHIEEHNVIDNLCFQDWTANSKACSYGSYRNWVGKNVRFLLSKIKKSDYHYLFGTYHHD